MKLSIVLSTHQASFSAVAFKGDFAENVQRIAALGYDGVELAIRDPRLVEADALIDTLGTHGLAVPAIGTGQAWGEEGLSFTDPDPSIRQAAIDRVLLHIPLAARLAALSSPPHLPWRPGPGLRAASPPSWRAGGDEVISPASPLSLRAGGGDRAASCKEAISPADSPAIIIGLLRGVVRPGVDPTQAMDWLIAALRTCSAAAEADGVHLALEPINRYETTLVNTVAEGLALIDSVGSPAFGLLLDTFHMNIEEPHIEASMRACGDRIYHFHVADSNRWPPGSGHLDFASILHTLHEIGYAGWVSGEFMPKPDGETAAQLAIEHLRPLLTTE